MPINFEIDRRAGIVRVTASGAVTLEEEKSCLERFLADPSHEPGFGILLDNRQRDPAATAEQVKGMAGAFELNREAIGEARLAIVVAREVSYGLARMFASLTEGSLVDTNIFPDISAAEKWLSSS